MLIILFNMINIVHFYALTPLFHLNQGKTPTHTSHSPPTLYSTQTRLDKIQTSNKTSSPPTKNGAQGLDALPKKTPHKRKTWKLDIPCWLLDI